MDIDRNPSRVSQNIYFFVWILFYVDIRFSFPCAWNKSTRFEGIISYHQHDYSMFACLVNHVLHVYRVGCVRKSIKRVGVFIFGLYNNHRTAFSNLGICNDGENVVQVTYRISAFVLKLWPGSILLYRRQIFRRRSSQGCVYSLKPAWKPTTCYLCIDVQARSSNKIDSCVCGSLEERFQVEDAVCSKAPLFGFYKSLVNIERNSVESESLNLLENIDPQRWHG